MIGALREIGIDIEPPKGTIYVWAPVPAGHTSASFAEEVLEQAGVVVSPGSSYGPNGEGFFRISLTVPDDRLTEAVERMRGTPRRLSAIASRLRVGVSGLKGTAARKQSRYAPAARRGGRQPARAPARALHLGAARRRSRRTARDELAELKELLRTAGVAVAGEMVQRRAAARPEQLLRQGQARGAEGSARASRTRT